MLNLSGNNFEVVEECTDLGIQRDCSSKTGHSRTIDERVQSARRCAYSLMGAGLHGQNGVSPRLSLSMWGVYVLPLSPVWIRHSDPE